MVGRIICRSLLLVLLIGPSGTIAREKTPEAVFTVADTRTELAGRWQGELEYRDYQANQWFGIPVTVEIELIDDGATLIRKASFDDGNSGIVYITVVTMLAPDGRTEFVGSFRADRPAELSRRALSVAAIEKGMAPTATHWMVVAEADGEDDNRPARIRETTTRIGEKLVTLKEIDFSDDDREEWMERNRTVLTRTVPVTDLFDYCSETDLKCPATGEIAPLRSQ